MLFPTKDEFHRLTETSRYVPVYRDVLADVETPLSAYWKLAHDETYSYLLESVTGGEQLARYSILGVRPRLVIRSKGTKVRQIRAKGESRSELPEGQDPLDLVKKELEERRIALMPGLPKFVGGAIGMLSYDIVRFFERLPDETKDDLNMDDMAMMLTDSVVIFDHAKNVIRILVLAEGTPDGYETACAEIERILSTLRRPLPALPNSKRQVHPVECNIGQKQYEENVAKTVEYIGAGDGVQMVVSQRFQTKVEAHPLTVYRALRSINPSPYMFLLRMGDYDVIGASPESLVSLNEGTAKVRPIAGTRWRGETPELDLALERELLADEKERAEHVMLVDLGRNDIGRVCEYGSVKVEDLMIIERYSHVMHIVSSVTGQLRKEYDAYGLIRATFPAGTVSGAPKVRAMEIIDELETTRRGLYAGAVGYVSATGDMDMCIAIRTILLKDGQAYVQAGAGIVFDSNPEKEYVECQNKAQACLKAIEAAQLGLDGAL